MKKPCLPVLFTVCVLISLFCAQIEAGAHKPILSGNFEQGWRLYESEEGNGDDYFFREGWLKWKQDFTSKSYYYIRFHYQANHFTTDKKWDSQTVDLLVNYTQQISKPIRLKTEIGLKNKSYPNDQLKKDGTVDPTLPEKDYYEVTGALEVTVKPWAGDTFFSGVKLQYETYPHHDKENMLTGMNLRWEHIVSDDLKVHTACNLSREDHFFQSALDKMRYSISVGFEYQL